MAMPVGFTDWYQSQTPVYLSPANMIRSAYQRQAYAWSLLARGKKMDRMLKAGTDIREKVALSGISSFANYTPNDPLTPQQGQNITTLAAKWAFGSWNMSWTKNERILNGDGEGLTDEARVMKYIDFQTVKESQFQLDATEGVEVSFSAVPDKDTMESLTAGKAPYSLPALINDHASTLFNNITGSGAFTTLHGVDPTATGKKLFRNRIFGYTSVAVKPTGGLKNMQGALDAAYIRLQYRAPFIKGAKAPQNLEDDGWARKIALISQTGAEKLQDLNRQRNDSWGSANSSMGMGDLEYKGMEFYALPMLETGTYYHSDYTTPATLVTEGQSTTNAGPRIYIIDTDALNIVFNRDRFFEREAPRQPDNQPFTDVVWGDVYYQFMITHRHLCGIISPGTVTGSFDAGTQALTTTNGALYTY